MRFHPSDNVYFSPMVVLNINAQWVSDERGHTHTHTRFALSEIVLNNKCLIVLNGRTSPAEYVLNIPMHPLERAKRILFLVLIHKNTECHTADTQKSVYWSKCASLLGLELSLKRYYSQFFIPTGQRKVYKDTKRIPVESANVANRVPCKHVSVCVCLC